MGFRTPLIKVGNLYLSPRYDRISTYIFIIYKEMHSYSYDISVLKIIMFRMHFKHSLH